MTAVHESLPNRGFRHEALFYASEAEFVAATTGFMRAGVARNEAVLTVVDARKIGPLRAAMGGDADRVVFADMATVGRNPALIIQAWRDFVESHRDVGRAVRGIGEPVSAERSRPALVECQIHESLLNLAFADVPDFWLLCPYDTTVLAAPVIEGAVGTHTFVADVDGSLTGGDDPDDDVGLARPLPLPSGPVDVLHFGVANVHSLRVFATERSRDFGVDADRIPDVAVAVSEIATNAVVHGDGRGEARFWIDDDHLVCEIIGTGRIDDPLVGRLRPVAGRSHGYGVWLANHACDLVQIRSCAGGQRCACTSAAADDVPPEDVPGLRQRAFELPSVTGSTSAPAPRRSDCPRKRYDAIGACA